MFAIDVLDSSLPYDSDYILMFLFMRNTAYQRISSKVL